MTRVPLYRQITPSNEVVQQIREVSKAHCHHIGKLLPGPIAALAVPEDAHTVMIRNDHRDPIMPQRDPGVGNHLHGESCEP